MTSIQVFGQQTAADFFKMTLNALKYGDYDNTILFATKAIALNPKYGAAYWNRAVAHDIKREYHWAINDYDSAMNYYSNGIDLTTLHKNRGMVYIDMREYDSAIADFDKALEMRPDYPLANWNRGIAEDALGQNETAIKDYDVALKQFVSVSDLCQLHLLKAIAYHGLKDADKALAEFKEILKLDTSRDYHTAYARFYLENKDSAKNDVRTAIIRARGNPTAYMNAYFDAARIFSVMDNKEKAMSCLEMSFDLGYSNFHNADSRDFDNVRDDPSFEALVKKYENRPKDLTPPKKQ